jgi:hypothetical protein
MVPRMLRQLTGIEPDHSVNPDEAVARGAALYANFLLAMSQPGATPGFQVVNVNSHSLGIEGIEPETLRKTNIILIPRNTPLPAKCTERFATKSDGQRSIVLQVLEGDSSLPGECTAIGRTVIRDLPPGLPKGWPVDITFEYASNGRLTVKAAVSGTSRHVALDMERDVGLSNDGIARWKQAVAGQSGFDAFETLLTDVLNLAAPGVNASLPGDPPAAASPSVVGVATPAASPPGGPGAASAVPAGTAAPSPLQPLPLPSSGKKAHWIAPPSGAGAGTPPESVAPPNAGAASAPSLALRFPAAPEHFQTSPEQWRAPADAIGLPEASAGSSDRLPSLRLDAAPAAPAAAGFSPVGAIPLPQALVAAPAIPPMPGAAPAARRAEPRRGALRKLFNLLALTLGGLVGIGIAYFILHKLQPQMFHWPR